MSTNLIDETNNKGFYLCKFYGGRGECYQITDSIGHYVQLTKEQMRVLVEVMGKEEEGLL